MGLAGAVTMEVSRLLSCVPSSLVEGEDLRRHAKVVAKCRHGVFICSTYPLSELYDERERRWRGRNVAMSQRFFSLAVTNSGAARGRGLGDGLTPHHEPLPQNLADGAEFRWAVLQETVISKPNGSPHREITHMKCVWP